MSLPSAQSAQTQPPTLDPQVMVMDGGGTRREIAVLSRAASPHFAGPGLVWLPGFRSDMRSTKASALDAWAAARGQALLRFDYSGHGTSSGSFEDGTIGLWLEETLAAIRRHSTGPQVLVGSSMGGWLALLAARALADAGEAQWLHAMVLVAPAVDFTDALMWPQFTPEIRVEIERNGKWLRPSAYGAPYPITRALIEDGRRHNLFGTLMRSHCPVHILQGLRDPDVPWQHAMKLVEHLASDPVVLTMIRDGDHRLSREADIALLMDITGRASQTG